MAQMITRCPACGTRFKVVPDQLRMSQGWVRCGRCAEIFDAAGQLDGARTDAPAPPAAAVDDNSPPMPPTDAPVALVETAAAPPWPLPPRADGAVDTVSTEPAQAPVAPPAPWVPTLQRASAASEAGAAVAAPAQAASPRLVVTLAAESVSAPAPARGPVADTEAMPLPQRPAVQAPQPAPAVPSPVVAAAPVPPPVPLDPAHAELSFLREAAIAAPPPSDSNAGQRGRWFWSLGAGLALVALLWQLAVHERDRLAASAPALRPLLEAACAPLGCEVQALRRIDAIVIDGSSFQALGERSYRLSLTLRNRAAHAVAVPALALALTDIAEQPVVRRVLLPQDFGDAPAALDAHGEWSTSVALQVAENAGGARVVGYRIDPFYP